MPCFPMLAVVRPPLGVSGRQSITPALWRVRSGGIPYEAVAISRCHGGPYRITLEQVGSLVFLGSIPLPNFARFEWVHGGLEGHRSGIHLAVGCAACQQFVLIKKNFICDAKSFFDREKFKFDFENRKRKC